MRGSLAAMKGTAKRVAVFALLLALPACGDGNRYEFDVPTYNKTIELFRCDRRTGEVWVMQHLSTVKDPDGLLFTWRLVCK